MKIDFDYIAKIITLTTIFHEASNALPFNHSQTDTGIGKICTLSDTSTQSLWTTTNSSPLLIPTHSTSHRLNTDKRQYNTFSNSIGDSQAVTSNSKTKLKIADSLVTTSNGVLQTLLLGGINYVVQGDP